MKSILYLPNHIPSPKTGSWFYFINGFYGTHSTGTVTQVLDLGTETAIRYQNSWYPKFSSRPIQNVFLNPTRLPQ